MASNQKGVTGENLLTLLERRIDNVVFRLKMASSRSQSRQMVVHGHICLNGKVTRSPSLITRPDDVVSIKDSVLSKDAFMKNVVEKRMNIGIKVPEWLELKKTEKRGSVLRAPERSEVSDTIAEHLIVELYSK